MKTIQHLATTLRRTTLRLASVVLACAPFAASADPAAPSEHAVKAAVLLRAAKFIEWPAAAFAGPGGPFVVCVVGDEDSARAFDALEGKRVDHRRVVVRRITGDMLDLRQCHAAFFPHDFTADVDYALGKLEGTPVLTVGESNEFAQRGGSLALVTRDHRVNFTINAGALRRAGISVSSQLLQLATVIDANQR